MSKLISETPLTGMHLIEASAGTGKTFTIGLLYLRALLGMGTPGNKPLDVANILVVTFTNAAADELSLRIRRRIDEALRHITAEQISEDLPLLGVLSSCDLEHDEVVRILKTAMARIDQARISTIHSFASSLVMQSAFDGCLPIGASVTIGEDELDTPVRNYWRKLCLTGQKDAVKQKSFADFKKLVLRLMSKPDAVIQSSAKRLSALQLQGFDEVFVLERIKALQEKNVISGDHRLAWVETSIRAVRLFLHEGKALPLKDVSRLSQASVNTSIGKKLKTENSDHMLDEPVSSPFKVCDAIIEQFGTEGELEHAEHLAQLEEKLESTRKAVLQNLEEAERQAMSLSADRLLQMACQAVDNEAMTARLRELFPLAMIDEFQDTDNIQFDMFSKVYADHPETGLLMIGDPKQAIYSFRGGDIFTYLRARKQASIYGMQENFRSTPAMITAVNAIFQNSGKKPFALDDLEFLPVKPGTDKKPLTFKYDNGEPQGLEAITTQYDPVNENAELPVAALRQSAATACAAYVQKLLYLGDQQQLLHDDESPVYPGDIAILVKTHAQGSYIKQALNDLDIASVDKSMESIFLQSVTQDAWYILQAIIEPQKERYLRTAIATTCMAYCLGEISEIFNSDAQKLVFHDCFLQAHEILELHGPLPAFLFLFNKLERAGKMIATIQERGMTDILQVLEILQSRYRELGAGHQLLKWFGDAISEADNAEEKRLRLESDEHRVQIVTVHGAKGLEYPVVLMPYLWEKVTTQDKDLFFYHKGETLYAGITHVDKAKLEEENFQESLRLLYVAMTRASRHAWLYFVDYGSKATKSSKNLPRPSYDYNQSPIAYYFPAESDFHSVDTARQALINSIALASKTADKVYGETLLSIDVPPGWTLHDATGEGLVEAEIFDGPVVSSLSATSFSALTRGVSISLKDVEQEPVAEWLQGDEKPAQGRFALARGAHIGTALHNILEYLPFNRFDYNDRQELESRVYRELSAYGVLRTPEEAEELLPAYCQWMLEILETPFYGENNACALKHLQHWKAELTFNLWLSGDFSVKALKSLLEPDYPMPDLGSQSIQGLMVGAIDLVFMHDGKYFLADYKSSWLGNDWEDYGQQELAIKNMQSTYTLQYLIYTVALHRYLSQRLGENYDYDSCFGGVYYLYLRGMHLNYPGKGIFFEKPSKELVLSLDKLFAGQFHSEVEISE